MLNIRAEARERCHVFCCEEMRTCDVGPGLWSDTDGKVVQSQSDTRAAAKCNLQKEAATNSAQKLPS